MGAHWGNPELGSKTPPLVRGSTYKKKIMQDLGLNQHTVATIHKKILTNQPRKAAISGPLYVCMCRLKIFGNLFFSKNLLSPLGWV